jgi:hypothetical protein
MRRHTRPHVLSEGALIPPVVGCTAAGKAKPRLPQGQKAKRPAVAARKAKLNHRRDMMKN